MAPEFEDQSEDGVQSRVKPAYAIFEGGGAKGITHIGALKALEQNGFEIVGAAGASAGAIIAALTAIGYSADELFDRELGTDLLERHSLSPIDLLGRNSWRWFNSLRHIAPWTSALASLVLLAILAVGSDYPSETVRHLGLLLVLLLVSPIILLLIPTVLNQGYLSTKQIREKLNDILRERLRDHYTSLGFDQEPPRYVRFSHIDPAIIPQCSLLKVIVSDAHNGCLVQFDQSTPDVIVADAVAASAAIPFVFQSPPVRGAATDRDPVYVDGGLISNLPVWAFASEKRALEREQQGAPIPIFAFTLAGKQNSSSLSHHSKQNSQTAGRFRSFFNYIWWIFCLPILAFFRPILLFFKHVGLVLQTGVFGSQAIIQDFISDLTVIQLQSPLNTLDFGCNRKLASDAFDAGFDQANAKLREASAFGELTEGLLADLLGRISAKIDLRRSLSSQEDPEGVYRRYIPRIRRRTMINKETRHIPRLRLYLLQPLRGGSYKVSETSAMDNDSDDRMEYDARSKLGPRVFIERQPIYTEYPSSATDLWMTKYEGALVSKDRCSIIAIPVFANPEAREIYGMKAPVQKALCLDSDDALKLEFEDPEFLDWLSKEAVVFAQVMLKDLIDG